MPYASDTFIKAVVRGSPDETRHGWEKLIWTAVRDDPAMLRAFFNDVVASFFRRNKVVSSAPNETTIMRRRKPKRPMTSAKARKGTTQKQKRRKVIALSLFTWTLKQTCGVLAQMGGVYADLAKAGKPNQVLGNIVSSMQARDVFRRHGMDINIAPVTEAEAA